MQVDIFTLCDNAQEYNGKMVIVGTFNAMSVSKFPYVHAGFAVVASIRFDKNEKKEHDFEISIKKSDADLFLMSPTKMRASNIDTQSEYTYINLIIKGNNIEIKEPGKYIVCLKIDDKIREVMLTISEQ